MTNRKLAKCVESNRFDKNSTIPSVLQQVKPTVQEGLEQEKMHYRFSLQAETVLLLRKEEGSLSCFVD